MALGYIDTISPQFHWGIQEFCVGNCTVRDLMRVVLSGGKNFFLKNSEIDDQKTECWTRNQLGIRLTFESKQNWQ